MEGAKEKAADAAATLRAGTEKAKAAVGEKKDKMMGHDPLDKDMATHKKDARMSEAELRKEDAHAHNAMQKDVNANPTTTTTTTATGRQYGV